MLDDTNCSSEETPLQVSRDYRTIPGRGTPTLTQDFTDFMHSKSMYIMCALNLAMYFLVAVVAYSFVFEQWPVVDSIYFACVTFTTVGYGDPYPSNDSSRAFTCVFALYGVVILGLLVGLVGQTIVEKHNAYVEAAKAKAQERVLQMFGDEPHDETPTLLRPNEKSLFETMRDIIVLEAPIVIVIALISLGIGHYEGWSVISSIYYGVITSSTVGYGDVSPQSNEMRMVAIVFTPIAVSVFCEVLGRIAGAYMARQTAIAEKAFLNRQLTLTDIERMDLNKDGKVTWGEFAAFMLVAMQKIEKADIDQIREIFDKLDRDKSNSLDKADLVKQVGNKTKSWFRSK